MIAIISEHRYSEKELIDFRKQGVVVNYNALPQFYHSYAEEIEKVNCHLIKNRTTQGIIFRIESYYAGTKDAIELALYMKKSIKIITPSGTYKDLTSDDWRQSYKDADNKNHTIKHLVLQEFEERRNAYYDAKNLGKAKEVYNTAVEGIHEEKAEIERFVRTFAPLYKIDVDYSNPVELFNAYKNISFYYENNIPYELDSAEIFKGAILPEDSNYFTADMFQAPEYDYENISVESFGDETLLEDVIYKERSASQCY